MFDMSSSYLQYNKLLDRNENLFLGPSLYSLESKILDTYILFIWLKFFYLHCFLLYRHYINLNKFFKKDDLQQML